MSTPLLHHYSVMKDSLPKGRLSRWYELRHAFGHTGHDPFAARAARWEVQDCGERTRARWEAEYRHQRKLRAIQRGTDYEPEQGVGLAQLLVGNVA